MKNCLEKKREKKYVKHKFHRDRTNFSLDYLPILWFL